MEINNRLDNREWFDKIESYLENTMTDDERIQFEEQIKLDVELRSAVEEQVILRDAIESQSMTDFMNEVHHELNHDSSVTALPRRRSIYKYMPIAASLILLIAVGYYLTTGAGGNQKLFKEHFKPDPGLPTTMGAQENYRLLRPMVYYKQGDYKKAIDEWTQFREEQETSNDTLDYYLGLSHLAIKNSDKAIAYLSNIVQSGNSKYLDKACYYLGLAYLLDDDVESAKKYLNLNQDRRSSILLKELSD